MYTVDYDSKALKQLKKMDKFQAKIIIEWIEENLVDCTDPRKHGKPLTANLNEFWRYRVGNYRVVAQIIDNEVIINIIKIGHRKDIYK